MIPALFLQFAHDRAQALGERSPAPLGGKSILTCAPDCSGDRLAGRLGKQACGLLGVLILDAV